MNRLVTFAATAWLLAAAAPAHAQAQAHNPGDRLMRGDVAGTIGWLSVNKSEFQSYNRWRSEADFGASLGWYWTNHLKTTVDASGSTAATFYSSAPVLIGNQFHMVSSRRRFSTQRVSVLQHYQFRDNEWLHPHLGAGLDVVAESTSRVDDPIFFYDQITRQSRTIRDGADHPETRTVRTRAMAVAGLKAYTTTRTFLLTDLRVSFGERVENVLWRVGFGVDF